MREAKSIMSKSSDMVYKTLVVGVIILLICISTNPSIATENIKKSSTQISNGNTLYVGGVGPNNYTKIQDAIYDSTDGDTVFVYDDGSPYYENIEVDKSINLIGENRDTTIIDGSGFGDVVFILSDWINMSGFTIRNSGDELYDAGINISSNSNIIIGNIFSENEWGIILYECDSNIITSNIIISNYWGIKILKSYINTIIFNHIILNDYSGIDIDYSNNNIISKNNISLNEHYGICLVCSNSNNITSNIINNNGYWGDMVWSGGGIDIDTSNENILSDNNISKNCLFGMFISNSSRNNINDNTISSSEIWGIQIEFFSDNNIIVSNSISKTYLCLQLVDSNNNIISKNNFLKKGNRVSFSNCTNTWKENYWNRPRILPKLIFGFGSGSSWWIPHFNIDWHPAKEPYEI